MGSDVPDSQQEGKTQGTEGNTDSPGVIQQKKKSEVEICAHGWLNYTVQAQLRCGQISENKQEPLEWLNDTVGKWKNM